MRPGTAAVVGAGTTVCALGAMRRKTSVAPEEFPPSRCLDGQVFVECLERLVGLGDGLRVPFVAFVHREAASMSVVA